MSRKLDEKTMKFIDNVAQNSYIKMDGFVYKILRN